VYQIVDSGVTITYLCYWRGGRQQMPATYDGELTVEKTPSYFVTKCVASRVHNMSSDVRLVVVVRDPVTRAISDYTQVTACDSNISVTPPCKCGYHLTLLMQEIKFSHECCPCPCPWSIAITCSFHAASRLISLILSHLISSHPTPFRIN